MELLLLYIFTRVSNAHVRWPGVGIRLCGYRWSFVASVHQCSFPAGPTGLARLRSETANVSFVSGDRGVWFYILSRPIVILQMIHWSVWGKHECLKHSMSGKTTFRYYIETCSYLLFTFFIERSLYSTNSPYYLVLTIVHHINVWSNSFSLWAY